MSRSFSLDHGPCRLQDDIVRLAIVQAVADSVAIPKYSGGGRHLEAARKTHPRTPHPGRFRVTGSLCGLLQDASDISRAPGDRQEGFPADHDHQSRGCSRRDPRGAVRGIGAWRGLELETYTLSPAGPGPGAPGADGIGAGRGLELETYTLSPAGPGPGAPGVDGFGEPHSQP